jgi:hypothetical protein
MAITSQKATISQSRVRKASKTEMPKNTIKIANPAPGFMFLIFKVSDLYIPKYSAFFAFPSDQLTVFPNR